MATAITLARAATSNRRVVRSIAELRAKQQSLVVSSGDSDKLDFWSPDSLSTGTVLGKFGLRVGFQPGLEAACGGYKHAGTDGNCLISFEFGTAVTVRPRKVCGPARPVRLHVQDQPGFGLRLQRVRS